MIRVSTNVDMKAIDFSFNKNTNVDLWIKYIVSYLNKSSENYRISYFWGIIYNIGSVYLKKYYEKKLKIFVFLSKILKFIYLLKFYIKKAVYREYVFKDHHKGPFHNFTRKSSTKYFNKKIMFHQ